MRVTIVLLALTLLGGCRSPYYKVPLAAPQMYLEGENALAKGNYAEAAGHFNAYLESGRESYRARALYQLARARYQMEDYTGAASTLDDLDREYPKFGRKQTTALRGDLAYALGHRSDAILLWEDAYSHSSAAERAALEPRITNAIAALSTDAVNDLARELTEPDIYDMAIDRLAGPAPDETWNPAAVAGTGVAGQTGEEEAAALAPDESEDAALDNAATATPSDAAATAEDPAASDTEVEAIPIANESAESSADGSEHFIGVSRSRVGCLLPLTGPRRDEGRFALQAVRESFDESSLVIRDSGGGVAEVRAIVRQLADDDAVVVMFGPMQAAAISAARAQANHLGLPMLALPAQPAEKETAQREARLAAYAVRDLGLRRIGIVAPRAEPRSTFEKNAVSLGATIVGTYRYNPEDAYRSGTLAAVQRWIEAGGIDAVYIPGRAAEATEIATAARAVDPTVVLLGNQGWNNEVILAAAAPTIEGAVIVGNGSLGGIEAEIAAAAEALKKVTKPGSSGRGDAKRLLAGVETTPVERPALLQIVDGRATAIQP